MKIPSPSMTNFTIQYILQLAIGHFQLIDKSVSNLVTGVKVMMLPDRLHAQCTCNATVAFLRRHVATV